MARDIQGILSSGRHLLGLVNGILDLARIEAGAMPLCLEVFDVAPFLEELAATFRPLAEGRGNTFRMEVPAGLPSLHTDATKLRQVLTNLVGNAAKFTEGGSIRLAASCSAEGFAFTVADDGIGMTPQQLERVFGAFVQAEDRTGRDHGGSGLGLAISHQLCALLGGSLQAESCPGRGTTMTVRLPVLPPGL